MSRLLVFALTLFAVVTVGAPARAQVISETAPPPFPDPKKFSRGFYAQGDLGALAFVGRTGRYAGPGGLYGVRLGYDILRWLSVQGHVMGSSGQVNLPGPTNGQAYETLIYSGEVHLQAQIRRIGLFAEGGVGAAQIPTNVLDEAGVTGGHHFSLAVIGGGGIEVHTLNRHFAFGASVDYIWMQKFDNSNALSAQAFIKYTR